MEQRRIRTLDSDRQTPLAAVTIDTSLILPSRSSKKWYVQSFAERKVSMAIGRKVYAEGISEYFWHFLAAAASSATSPRPRAAVAT